jgi:alkanesulfonate monooxygenase SsuD/methylene tetrahydromethanopterin reductase-like flavin-dependent oxidoreductase (luciferase family)
MEAAALDEVSHGRVLLGLGAALWTLRALGEADARTERPLGAMLEGVRVVRAMLSGSEAVDGQIFRVRRDAHLDFSTCRPAVPVYVGAVNARMLRAAGMWADGVQLGAMVSPGYARWACEQIAAGASCAARDAANLDAARARAAVREVMAYYMHRVEPVVLSTSGADPQKIERVRVAVLEHGAEAGARLIDDELIDSFAAAGDPEHVAERLVAYLNSGIRGLLAWHVIGPDRRRGMELLARVVRPRVFGN